MSKKLILVTIIVLILIFGIYRRFFRKEEPTFTLTEVTRGTVSQEVSETGQIKKGEEINLSFNNGGSIEKIYVEVGEEVEEGAVLVKLKMTQLEIQLQEAKAALSLAQAQFNKLLAGATQEEIQIAKTAVDNSQISLETAQQDLEDIKNEAQESLNNAYEDALNVLDDSYLKIYNSLNVVDSIQQAYFGGTGQESLIVKENKDKIENAMSQVKSYLDTAKADSTNKNIDIALSEMREGLEKVSGALKIIRETCETPNYRNVVSSTHKTSLDTKRTNINTALTNSTDSQQTISSTKISNESDINTAQSTVLVAEGALKANQDELAKIIAPPRQEDVDLYQAQVDQAWAKVALLENQIQEATLTTPISGQIKKIHKEVGEQVQPTSSDIVISLIPTAPFQIKADIYEEDIIKIKVGNLVDISLVVFPDQLFEGRVISIEPAEKLIEGVVYYEVTVGFIEILEEVKPGMTADVVIETSLKENVLIIPEEVIQEKNEKLIVQVFENGIIKEREIEIGLEGKDMVEVVSGLKEGEKIIIMP